jgi:hypothetical protein
VRPVKILLDFIALMTALEVAELNVRLEPWTNKNSRGHQRIASSGPGNYSIKCIGVWDTVGAIGIPTEVPWSTDKMQYGHHYSVSAR